MRCAPSRPVSYTHLDVYKRQMQDGVFVAEDVLAKHDETYMPKEVADKMGMAHKKHDVQTPPATGAAN